MGRDKPTVRLRELGLALSRAAAAKGINGVKLADRLGWTPTKVSRVFNGQRPITPVDAAEVLAVCGIIGPKRDELIKLAERAQEPGWWQEYGDRLPLELTTLSDFEDAAIVITNFENTLVPGLLQTPEYMRRLMWRTPAISQKEISQHLEARARRQEVLDRRHPAKFVFFLDEYALARTGPGREVMSEQLHHLLRLSVRNYVEIRIISDAVGFHPGRTPFHIMEFTEFHPVVFIENQTSVLFLERPDTITGYHRIAAHLDNVALDERQSREWLTALATELGAPREEHDEHDPPLEEEFFH